MYFAFFAPLHHARAQSLHIAQYLDFSHAQQYYSKHTRHVDFPLLLRARGRGAAAAQRTVLVYMAADNDLYRNAA
jgi:hypothetical protein